MRAAERKQSAFDGKPALLKRVSASQALRRDCNNRGKRIFYAMMQFLQQQALELFCGFAFRGVDSSLGKQTRCIQPGLCQ